MAAVACGPYGGLSMPLLVLAPLHCAPSLVRDDPQRLVAMLRPLCRGIHDHAPTLAVAHQPHPAAAAPDDEAAVENVVQDADAVENDRENFAADFNAVMAIRSDT